ncbi:hypothetical protein SSP35_10_01610 [Streptomyces sp. NBRC 110611]|uniref:DUF1295 domain-containing protein n=1 Tax=Streptomyces sp. NBRC 110611 TaxID=1621259 RepID=UPI000855E1E4|nr:DUF1295 domain-containing protein [Streptomyces sp. NBRC 110611]GAU69127.1 hypothetical protein SSP35_10_01610 [Streptomyces sp. NBRC 110611]
MAAIAFLGFVAVLFAGSRWTPGRLVPAATLGGDQAPAYRLNGAALFASTVSAAAACWFFAPHALAWPARHWWELCVAANVFAFTAAGVLLVAGRRRTPAAARRKGWRGVLADYYYGAELNPVWAGVDLKFFSYRPSLIGLFAFNASTAAVQYADSGTLSGRMILYQTFFFLYLANYFQFEGGMVYTWDLMAERFGWALVWGDYVLVPFFYSIAGFTLVRVHEPLPFWLAALCCVLFVFGFWLFRGANDQKHRFKTDPTAQIWGRPAEALGGRLLVSGFWGIGRKLNYTGELLVYLSWTLLCGTASAWPYLLPAFLLVLFIHRAHRDDRRCRAKYGRLWEMYCARARFRMFPFVY